MRARLPDREDFVVRGGVKVAYDVYDNDEPTILLMPTWSILHSRHWKLQIPYLARHFRVLTVEGRGNGRSDRPTDPAAYSDDEFVSDALAVLDATSTDRAVVAGVSMGGHWTALMAGLHPDRVMGAVLLGAVTTLTPGHPGRDPSRWGEELESDEGWAKYNMHYWRHDYSDFVEFFFSQVFSEAHSTKQHKDCSRWAHETDAETLIATERAEQVVGVAERDVVSSIRCPVLVIHGTDDHVRPHAGGEALATATGGTLLSIEGGGHCPQARDPVMVNLAIRRFVDGLYQSSSPIPTPHDRAVAR